MELLIRSIVAAVLAHLAEKSKLGASRPKILALLTGGSVGVNEALTSLIQDFPAASYTLVLTAGAERIHDVPRIEKLLRSEETLKNGQEIDPWSLVTGFTAVVVLTLSRNTAAKVARTLFDGLGSAIILEALMSGIPVVAARDAADPEHPFWAGRGGGAPHPGLATALSSNLRKMEQIGVRLVPGRLLGSETASVSVAENQPEAVKSGVITAKDILPLAKGSYISIACGTVVTPLARELSQEMGIALKVVGR